MQKKLRVAVLMGGPSSEHDVSIQSGTMVVKYLNRNRYDVTPFVISRRGKWPLTLGAFKKRFDLAFLALHGEYGEDGSIQKILARYRIPFTFPSKSMPLSVGSHSSEYLNRMYTSLS